MTTYNINSVEDPSTNLYLPGYFSSEIYKVERQLMVKYLEGILKTAGQYLGDPNGYGGPYPSGSQFGFTKIRPFHMGGTEYSWRVSVSSTGWQNLSTLDDKTIPKDTWILLLGLEDPEPSLILDSVKMSISTTNLPILVFDDMKYNKDHLYFLPKPIVLTPSANIGFEVYANATGYTSLQPVGFAVTKGINLSKKSYYD